MTNPNTTNQSEWVDCQGGEISGLVHKLKQKKQAVRRMQIMRSLSLAAGIMLMVGVGWMFLAENNPPAEANYGGIVCSDVIKNSKSYLKEELDPEIQRRIQIHLGECENCRHKMAMLRDQLGIAPVSSRHQQQNESVQVGFQAPIAVTWLRK